MGFGSLQDPPSPAWAAAPAPPLDRARPGGIGRTPSARGSGRGSSGESARSQAGFGGREHEQTLHGVLPRKGQKPGEFCCGKQYFRLSAMVEKKREKLTNPSRVPPCLGEPLHPGAAPFFCDSLRVRDRNRAR